MIAPLFGIGAAFATVGLAHLTIRTITAIGQTDKEHTIGDAVRTITSVNEWNALTSSGQCILFVDCDWNIEIVAFRQPFADFSTWSHDHTGYKSILVKVDSECHDEMWSILQDLWQVNSISLGGLKNLGGAGRVVWFKDGRVVDSAWCTEVFGVEELKTRTTAAFQIATVE